MLSRIMILCIASVAIAATGCSKGSKNGLTLKGKVTYNSSPASRVVVKLHAADGKEFAGVSDEQGQFTINEAVPGEMKVSFSPMNTGVYDKASADQKSKMGGNMPNMNSTKLPAKFSNPATSGQTWSVSSSSLTKDFELKD